MDAYLTKQKSIVIDEVSVILNAADKLKVHR